MMSWTRARRLLCGFNGVILAVGGLLALGPALADFFKEQFGPETATIGWRMLCVLAAGCSLTATVATQLQTSKNYEGPIAQAQEIMASLDVLEAAITLGHLDQNEATDQYLKIIKGTSFMHQAGKLEVM